MDILEFNQIEQERFRNNFRVNTKVLELDLHFNLNEIIVHHYLINEMYKKSTLEVEATLKDIESKTKLSLQQVRTSIRKLEEKGIIEVQKGHGKKPSIYKYIIG